MKNITTAVASLTLAAATVLTISPQAYALDTFDVGVGMFWNTCLSTKVPGTFQLQVKKGGQSAWTTVGSSKAWDDRNTEDGSCPTYAVGAVWTPKTAGTYDIRLFNASNKKSYESKRIAIAGPVNTQPTVQTVKMPQLVNAYDGQAKTWLFNNGYKFSFNVESTGFNPKLSCLMSGRNVILSQKPLPGTVVVNQFSTRVTVKVNCEW